MKKFLMDMVSQPNLAGALIERIGDVYCDFYERFMQSCGDYIDMIELPGMIMQAIKVLSSLPVCFLSLSNQL